MLLENVLPIDEVRDDVERAELERDIREECETFGGVASVAIPLPPPGGGDSADAQPAARVYVRFQDAAAAGACLRKMDGRKFDGNLIRARHVDEADFGMAEAGEWI